MEPLHEGFFGNNVAVRLSTKSQNVRQAYLSRYLCFLVISLNMQHIFIRQKQALTTELSYTTDNWNKNPEIFTQISNPIY